MCLIEVLQPQPKHSLCGGYYLGSRVLCFAWSFSFNWTCWQYEGSDVEIVLDKIHATQREAHHTAEAEAAKCDCILLLLSSSSCLIDEVLVRCVVGLILDVFVACVVG